MTGLYETMSAFCRCGEALHKGRAQSWEEPQEMLCMKCFVDEWDKYRMLEIAEASMYRKLEEALDNENSDSL